MMTIEEAILQANQIYVAGWEAQRQEFRADPQAARQALEKASQHLSLREVVEEMSTYRSGKVTVTRVLDRAVGTCPYCGAQYNAGYFSVRHEDGREVRFDVGLVHSANEGHHITIEDLDIDSMVDIMEDAQTGVPSSEGGKSENQPAGLGNGSRPKTV